MYEKYHYPNRFKGILDNPENRKSYMVYKAIKLDLDIENDFLDRMKNFRAEIESQRGLIKPLSKRRNELKSDIRALARERKNADGKDEINIQRNMTEFELELKMVEKTMLRLGRQMLNDLEKEFNKIKAVDDIYSVFPKETKSAIEAALKVNSLPPSNIFYWIVELAMKVDSMIKQYSILKKKRKFRSPAGDRSEKYLGNEAIQDHFLDVFALFNNFEKSFFIRYPNDKREVKRYLNGKRGDFDRLLAQYEILDEDYPELIKSFPSALSKAFKKIGTTYPLLDFPETDEAYKLIKTWLDISEQTLKDASDFSEVFVRVKSLYPMTIGMRSTDTHGRNLEYMKYVESLNTLLDDALSRKSLSPLKLELLVKAYRFYSGNSKFQVAMSMHY